MSARVEILKAGILLCAACTVDHISQMAVTISVIAMTINQKVLGKFKDNRNKTKQFKHDRLMHVAMEPLNLSPVSLDDLRVRPFVLGDEFEDVVHLHVVTTTREDLNRPEWPIPVVAPGFEVGAVRELLGFREFKEFLTDGKLAVYFLLGESEVGDVEKSYRFCVLES